MFETVGQIKESITMTRLGLVENRYTLVHMNVWYPSNKLSNIIGDRNVTMNHGTSDVGIKFEDLYKDYMVNIEEHTLEYGMLSRPGN